MPSDRSDFLLDFYRLLTDDIRRSEAIIPTVSGLELGVTVLLVAVRYLHGPTYLPALIAMLTSAWAMHMLINANLWARRSHLMATNVEKEFLTREDMNVLLPRSYYDEARSYRFRRVFRVSLIFSLTLFLIAISFLPLILNLKSMASLGIAVLLLCSLYLENRNCAREYGHLIEHAPGREL